MDVDAVLRPRPQVALVDELAHTNIPGSRNAKRWQDVEELLAAGIDVISTVNIQHLESLGDVVESITGVRQRETVPDEVVRRADQIELVDMSPQALRRRMAHGNIYQPDKVDAALSNYFRPGNLTALRELALLWVADRVDEYLKQYRSEHQVSKIWGSRERIVVGLTGGPEGRTLIRRAARLAEKGAGGEVLAVYIASSDGLTAASPKELAVQRTLVEDLGGTFHHVVGDDVPAALLDFARGVNATQIVLGFSAPQDLAVRLRAGRRRDRGPRVGTRPRRPHRHPRRGGQGPRAAGGQGRPARPGADHLGLAGRRGRSGALALLLNTVQLGLANDMLLFLALTVAAALLGGLLPALASAAVGSLLLNYFYTPPLHHWTIADPKNIVAIVIFVGVGISVASVVDLAARRTHQAARLRAESEILSFLAGNVLRGETGLEELLERVRETFGMESAALLERAERRRGPWTCAGRVGPGPSVERPEDGGRGHAGRRPHGARADRPGAARRGPPGAGRLRRAGGRRPGPTAAAGGGRPGPGARRGQPHPHGAAGRRRATICGRRWPASRRRCRHCAPTTWPGPRRTRRSCWRASRTAPTGSTTSSATSSTCPVCRPARSLR